MTREPLQLSGLQHFAYCPRQWAHIHLEQQWQENDRTADGHIFHARAHDGPEHELRGDLLVVRGLRVFSDKLGISGSCDVVEFHRQCDGVCLPGYEGCWQPYPVEYKRGEPKPGNADRLQLCAQAMCLEEMLLCDIPEGSLYYGEIRRREVVPLDETLRAEVAASLEQMHKYHLAGHTPKAKPTKGCNACSLREVCLPKLARISNVTSYINERLEDDA